MINQQTIIRDYTDFEELVKQYNKIMLVCGKSIKYLEVNHFLESLKNRFGIDVIRFNDFHPNPDYVSVENGVKLYRSESCQAIVVVGGGSAIDVAKCIKLYAYADTDTNMPYIFQSPPSNEIPLIVVPTTAGTGSEATRYAVIYYDGEKQSISNDSIIPDYVFFDSSVLKHLPAYQKKSTMLDALSHSIESFWSINSTEKSREYSKSAIELILEHMDGYLNNTEIGNAEMLKAANIAGKAINITQTTAGHAMSYKLTSMYGIAHGHACALCLSVLWPYMNNNIDDCTDPRGKSFLADIMNQLGITMGGKDSVSGADNFKLLLRSLDMPSISVKSEADYRLLTESVNHTRLNNNPICLNSKTIDLLYRKIL